MTGDKSHFVSTQWSRVGNKETQRERECNLRDAPTPLWALTRHKPEETNTNAGREVAPRACDSGLKLMSPAPQGPTFTSLTAHTDIQWEEASKRVLLQWNTNAVWGLKISKNATWCESWISVSVRADYIEENACAWEWVRVRACVRPNTRAKRRQTTETSAHMRTHTHTKAHTP